jgi:hypothetical protein
MTRICFLGNSHLACLRLAADRDPRLIPGGPAAWFAGSASSMNGLHLEKGRCLAPRGQRLKAQMAAISGGISRVDLTAHDLFVIVGIGLDYRDVFRLFRTHCLASDVAKGRQAGRAPVSASFFRAFLADMHATRPGERIARQIRAVNPAARVTILPAPYPSETILDHEEASGALAGFKGSDCFADMARIHLASATRAAEAAGAELVPQDPATLAAPGFTMARYNVQAVGLQSPHKAHAENWHGEKSAYDPWHMNADLGRARLLDLARALGAAPLAASA